MKSFLKGVGLLLILLIAYLALWPVPVAPAKWDAPVDKGYVGDFSPNTELANLEQLDIGDIHGPEDVAAKMIDGRFFLFVSSQDGLIRKLDPLAGTHETFADTKGVPLGLEFDSQGNLIVADAYKGLLSIDPSGQVSVLSSSVDGTSIDYADDLDITDEGLIYFSDASTKFGAAAAGSTMSASLLEIMESAGTGRVLAYDPADGSTRTVMDGLVFANGVAMSPDSDYILVNETGRYRVLKHWIAGERAGETDVVIDNLPGFPDNINPGPDDSFFVGLVSKRAPVLDQLAAKPFWRKVVWRLPEFMKPAAENYGFVFQMDGNGNVIRTWQDPKGIYPLTTGAIAPGDGFLYISSLGADHLGRRPYP